MAMRLPKPKTVILEDVPKLMQQWSRGNIVVSPKADGRRVVIQIDLDGSIVAKSVGTREIPRPIGFMPKSVTETHGATLVDAELVKENAFVCFDIFSNECHPKNADLGTRMILLAEIIKSAVFYDEVSVECKQFFAIPEHFTSYNDLVRAITYPIDGLIFTPISSADHKIYKWKPSPTIDARCKFIGQPFYNPITHAETESAGYEVKIHLYVVDDASKQHEVRFIPVDDPEKGTDWLRAHKDPENLTRIVTYTTQDNAEIKDGCIYEFAINCADPDSTWIPLRQRNDKHVPNTLSVANKVWKSAQAASAF